MGTLQGPTQSFPGGTSESYTTPYPVGLGTKARDANGNEFVFCNASGATVAPEMAVVISADWTITPITSGGARGSVGVVSDLGKSGNTSAPVSPYPAGSGVWVQVYGRTFVQVGTNASSPSDAANGPVTVGTSVATRFVLPTSATTPVGVLGMVSDNPAVSSTKWFVDGIFVASDVSLGDVSAVTAVSATHYGARAAVFLNYPIIRYEDASPS